MSSKMSRRFVGGDGSNAHRSCNDGFHEKLCCIFRRKLRLIDSISSCVRER
jgi:hypothetical protein